MTAKKKKTKLELLEEYLEVLQREGEAAIMDTIHPRFGTHTQATLRWSTTEPPMAQIPGAMECIFGPREGWVFWRYDWSALHLWLTAAYARDEALLAALRAGDDVHTLNSCDLFNIPYPPDRKDPHRADSCQAWREEVGWKGKDDERRTLAKRFLYRVLKGGDYSKPPQSIPLAVFGGSSKAFTQAATRWALAHTPIITWQATIKEKVRRTGVVSTAWGKRRVFSRRDGAAQRGGIDFMCQGTEADILNQTILLTAQALPPDRIRFMYQRHDCIIWEVKQGEQMEETLRVAAQIASRDINIMGVSIPLEPTYHIQYSLNGKKEGWIPHGHR